MADFSISTKKDRELFMKIYFMRLRYVKDVDAFNNAQIDVKRIKEKWDSGLEDPATTLVK